jgi:hypothetical protein
MRSGSIWPAYLAIEKLVDLNCFFWGDSRNDFDGRIFEIATVGKFLGGICRAARTRKTS